MPNTYPISIGAVVAAAGLSSRMGAFKPLLPIDQTPVIERCARNLLNAGVSELVIVTGYRSEEIQACLQNLPVKFVNNERYAETQMFDSICLGLQALTGYHDRILVTPGDVPLVSQNTILRLIQTSGEFVSPVCNGISGHPVILDAAILPGLLSFHGEGGLRGAIVANGIPIHLIETEDIGMTIDLDTPEDYSKVLSLLNRVSPIDSERA